MKSGYFISVEGVEGVGKSTLLTTIREWLEMHRIPHCLTREPGGTAVAEVLRETLLHTPKNEALFPQTELLLMFAARAQHVGHVIAPALARGEWVVSDRFVDASYAYQGGGRGLSMEWIAQLEHYVLNGIKPDKTILLDMSVEKALGRVYARSNLDRFEAEHVQFFDRVRDVYLERATNEPERFIIIDASQPLERVQEELILRLDQLWKEKTLHEPT